MKIIYIFLLLMLIENFSYSQSIIEMHKPEIIKNGTGFSNHDQSLGVFEDPNGNLYQTGYFEGEITFGNTTLVSAGGRDIFVAKINKDGGWDWAVSAGGTSIDYGKDITCDNSGNIFVTGYYYNTAYFGSYSVTSIANSDVFIAKLSNLGEWLWVKSAGGTGLNRGSSLACDNSGSCYVTGSFETSITFGSTTLSSSGLRDIFVAKISSIGNWIWSVKAGGSSTDEALGIRYNLSNNFVAISGYYSTTATFGSTTLTALGGKDLFVSRLDTSGSWTWVRSVGTTGAEESRAIAIDGNGNCLITGFYTASVTFGGTTLPAATGRDVYVAKIDKSGNWIWAKNATGSADDETWSIGVDNSGNGYITGSFVSDIKFGNNELFSIGIRNLFVARISSSGNWSWGRIASGTSSVDGYAISTALNGNSIVVGAFYEKCFAVGDTLTSKGETDIFTSRISNSGVWAWSQSASGVTGIVSSESVTTDTSGNIIVTGNYFGTIRFGNDTIQSKGGSDIFVAISTPEGNWLKSVSFGGLGDDFSYCATSDTDNNIYLTGSFSDNVDFGIANKSSNGLSDLFIIKLNSGLQPLWVNTTGDVENDFGKKIINFGNTIFVSGVYSKKPYFGAARLNAKGNEDVFITKLDTAGAYQWTLSMGSNQFETINSLACDNTGNLLITGSFEGNCYFGQNSISSEGGDDIYLAKASADGQWVWQKSAGTLNIQEAGFGIALNSVNEIYLTGIFKGLCKFGGEYLLSNGSNDIFVSKLDSNGNWIWTKSYGGSGTDFSKDLKIINNTIQICGSVASSFSVSNKVFNANGLIENGYLSGMDLSGNILWVLSDQNYGTSEFNSINQDLSNNTVCTGNFSNSLKIGNKSLNGYNSADQNSFFSISGFVLQKPDWQFRDSTGFSSTILVPKNINPKINGRNIAVGDAIGIFYSRNSNFYCAGMGYWNNNDLEITIWGDDPNTIIKDGFSVNDNYNIFVWDAIIAESVFYKARYAQGPEKYQNDAYSVLLQLPKTYDTLRINLAKGWNMISSNTVPEIPKMDSVFLGIKNNISLVKSASGKNYIPQYNINTIGDWNVYEGYQVYIKEICVLEILGDLVNPNNLNYSLNQGWSLISYNRTTPMNAITAFASLVSQNKLVLVKSSDGKTYIPQFGINGIGNLIPGQGYQIYLNSTAQFKFPSNN